MRRVQLVNHGTFESRQEIADDLLLTGHAALIERGRPRVIVVNCPCGCGEKLAMNLDRRAGKAWRLHVGEHGVSLFPSVWRDTGCESHFILWRNTFYVFEESRDDIAVDEQVIVGAGGDINARVYRALAYSEAERFDSLAE